MIELAAPLLIAPDVLSLIPALEEAPVGSTASSVPTEQNFSALLTELIGPAEEEEKGNGTQEAQKESQKAQVKQPEPIPVPLVPFVLAPVPFMVASPAPGPDKPAVQIELPEPVAKTDTEIDPQIDTAPLSKYRTPEMQKAWDDVKKFEFTVQQEPLKPQPQPLAQSQEQSQQLQPHPQVTPAAAEATPAELIKQPLITTDPIANVQQEQLPQRIVSLQKAGIETRLPERGKPEAEIVKTEATPTSTIQFQDLSRSLEHIEQARPAHHVEMPVMPQLQTVRTVNMQIGEADSQVMIRIQERGGDIALQINAANEPLHNNLQTSVNTLVHALRREEVQISSIEVTRKQPIDKVRRAKEAH